MDTLKGCLAFDEIGSRTTPNILRFPSGESRWVRAAEIFRRVFFFSGVSEDGIWLAS